MKLYAGNCKYLFVNQKVNMFYANKVSLTKCVISNVSVISVEFMIKALYNNFVAVSENIVEKHRNALSRPLSVNKK